MTERLEAAGCVAASDEARELVEAASDEETLEALLARRELGEPFAWILGSTRFCGRTIRVDRGVYVPRAQSEELARRAARLLRLAPGRAADLCTGSGAVAAHLVAELPEGSVVAVDLDETAVRCARRNGVDAVLGDLGDPLASGRFSLVTAVAPYVPAREIALLPSDFRLFEPRAALDGGADGLEVVRRVVGSAARILRDGGWLVIELGARQDEELAPVLAAAGFDSVTTWFDEDGDLRGLQARLGA